MDCLTASEIPALREALDDEYRAWATYDQVVTDFGEVCRFVSIRNAEARDIDALSTLFARYGLPIPVNTWVGKATRFASVQQACEAAVTAEIANGEMVERLVAVTQRPDIVAVLRNLQQASQQRHLPAFERCAQRGASGSGGGRHRRGRGAQS